MIIEIFKAFMITSLVGTVFTILLTALRPVTKKIFGYSWHYYIWIAVLLVMILPVRFQLPYNNELSAPIISTQQTQTLVDPDFENNEGNVAKNNVTPEMPAKISFTQHITDFIGYMEENGMNILCTIWLVGIFIMFFITVAGYIRLVAKINKTSYPANCPGIENYTKGKIEVRACDNMSSPFIIGIFRHKLILPAVELTGDQLDNILRHEMMHYRRKDIICKWFSSIVKCIHWFNPFVYYAVRQMNIECEISCDMAVVQNMSKEEKMSYVNTILSLLSSNNSKNIPLTTGMTGSKKILKRRFAMIKKSKKINKFMSVLSLFTALIMFSVTVCASGVLSSVIKEDYMIDIIMNGEKISLENKPFIEYNTIYLPLRELLNKEGIDNENISYNNGYAEFFVHSEEPINYRGEIYDYWINRVLIGSKYCYIMGHSQGSTENAELLRAPILKNDITYIPYDLILKLKSQGIFEAFNVSVEGDSLNGLTVEGELYRNEEMNFSLEIPLDWVGKYGVEEKDNSVTFYNSKIYGEYGEEMGMLFSIERYKNDIIPSSQNMEFITINGNDRYFIRCSANNINYIQANGNKENTFVVEEYEQMKKSIRGVKESFSLIVRYAPLT